MSVNEFSEFELLPELLEAVREDGYTEPTEIQRLAIPAVLAGDDVIGQAKTGTGKTAAFALPLLARLDAQGPRPQVLVLAPTRELALQVAEAFETYARNLPRIRVATIYGGQSYGVQFAQLKQGPHVVVGTPGRVIDHIQRGTLKLQGIGAFVLDEADKLLEMGFAEDVERILRAVPQERQTLLFSATMPDKLAGIVNKHLKNPTRLSSQSDTMTSSTVAQRACLVSPREKIRVLSRILESETSDGTIIFVKTKDTSSRLAELLCQRGFSASSLNGDMAQHQRERAIERLRSGQLNIVVATDVAARGLDVDRISHVINYDFPHDTEAYVHRIGRTGRAGRQGHAILMVAPRERYRLRQLESATGQEVTWMQQPTTENVRTVRMSKLQTEITAALAGDLTDAKQFVSSLAEANPDSDMQDIAAALTSIVLRGRDTADDSADHKSRGPKRGRSSYGERPRRGESSSGRFEKKNRRDFRSDRGGSSRDRRPSKQHQDGRALTKYRIEVGRAHGVGPGNIVGAITAESGLNGSQIGGIDIQTQFSTVDLPSDLPEETLQGLRQLRVSGQALRISKWNHSANGRFNEKPRQFNRKKGGKPTWKKTRKPNKSRSK